MRCSDTRTGLADEVARRRPVNAGLLYSRREPYGGCGGKTRHYETSCARSTGCGRPLAARWSQAARLRQPPFVRTPENAGRDRRQDAVELLGIVDDSVAMGEPQQQPIDERQRDVAQVLDHGRFQL